MSVLQNLLHGYPGIYWGARVRALYLLPRLPSPNFKVKFPKSKASSTIRSTFSKFPTIQTQKEQNWGFPNQNMGFRISQG